MSELEQSQQAAQAACAEAETAQPSEVEVTEQSAQPAVAEAAPAPAPQESAPPAPVPDLAAAGAQAMPPAPTPGLEDGELQQYRHCSFSELVEMLREVNAAPMTVESRNRGREINAVFFRKLRAFRQTLPQRGEADDDAPSPEPTIPELPIFNELYGIFKRKVSEYAQAQEAIRAANLARRREIVRQIGHLTERAEVKDETYREFKQLMQAWREIGPVPPAEAEGVFQSFHHQVESFYAYIKINRELRDLDYKRNLDEKTGLCEQAEDLIAMGDVPQAFKMLQALHAKWKEVGPVAPDKSEEIWARFSAASALVNARHRDYYQQLKAVHDANLASKEALCEAVEAILATERKTPADWGRDAKQIIEIQQRWRTIGPASRKQSDRVWARFQGVCEQFFNARREHDRQLREVGRDNLQLKLDLCLQAEALKDSTDWRNASREMIELQAKWKAVGYTPYKKGNELWQRFQAAQNHFFEQRNAANAQQRSEQGENLRLKLALLQELEAYTVGDNPKEAVEWLKGIQSRWGAIGFVPLKRKEELQSRYRELLDKFYSELRLEMKEQRLEEFKQSLDEMQGDSTDVALLQREKGRLRQRARVLENERIQMETNMAFFTASKGNDPILEQLQAKLKNLQGEIETIREKMKHIDQKVRSATKE